MDAEGKYVVGVIGGKPHVLVRRDDPADRYIRRGLRHYYEVLAECPDTYSAIDISIAMTTAEAMGEFEDKTTTEQGDINDERFAFIDQQLDKVDEILNKGKSASMTAERRAEVVMELETRPESATLKTPKSATQQSDCQQVNEEDR